MIALIKIRNAIFSPFFLKMYGQVPLADHAREILALCTPNAPYQYQFMPFGKKNAPAMFQRMVNHIVTDIEGFEAYMK